MAKATIYRTLPLLVDCGIINQVQFGGELARYEHTFAQTPHDHMVCRRCGRIIEFDSAKCYGARGALAAVRLRARVASVSDYRDMTNQLGEPHRPEPSAGDGTAASKARRKTGSPRR